MSSEIDELAESIMDYIMNSHHIPDREISYVEKYLPMKAQDDNSLCIELFEKIDKDRVQKVAIIFKTHDEALQWYFQFKQHAMKLNRVPKKAIIINNVVFKLGDYGKQLPTYVEYICEYINQQPICVLQHNIMDQDLKQVQNNYFHYKIYWNFNGPLPKLSALGIHNAIPDSFQQFKIQIDEEIQKEEELNNPQLPNQNLKKDDDVDDDDDDDDDYD